MTFATHHPDGLHLGISRRYTYEGDPNATLVRHQTYVFAADGTVQLVGGSEKGNSITIIHRGAEVYPSLQRLREGGSMTSTAEVELSSSNPHSEELLTRSLLPGQTAMKSALTYEVSPAPPLKRLVTRIGTFTNVVGVRVRTVKMRLINAAPLPQASLNAMQSLFTKSGGSTHYYARGTGVATMGASLLGGEAHLVSPSHCSG